MDRVRLMTFNLRRDVPADGPLAWAHRARAAAETVLAEAPDVLATQEGLPHQLADLDRALPGYRRVGGCRRGDGTDEHGALWWRDDRLALEAWGEFWLSDDPDRPGSATWGHDLPRMATWARLRVRATGARAVVASTHLDHRSADARLRSAALLAARLPGAFLLGDFNEAPGGPTHAALLAHGWRDAGAGSAEGTYHGYGRPRDRIDWVLAPGSADVLAHRVPRPRPGGGFPSDHDPVVVDVALPRAVPVRPREADRSLQEAVRR